MPGPKKYDINKLNKNSEFLCEKGGTVYDDKLDMDYKQVIDARGQVVQDSTYYCTSKTNLPAQILNTGNADVLKRYIAKHNSELNETEKQHLSDRLDVMKYLDEVEIYYQEHPRTSSGPLQNNEKGEKVFPGLLLDRPQDTGNGCWSCAFSLLLKGRGVELDQKVIRRFRPEFVEGHELNAAWQTDMVNGNIISEIFQYSSLVSKVCPNTKMTKMNLGGALGTNKKEFKAQILSALREKNAPVAFCSGNHWTTIVGASDDGKTFYVADSMRKDQRVLTPVDADDYLNKPTAEIVWLEDIVLDKDGLSQQLPGNRFKVDKDTGTIRPNITGFAIPNTTDLSTSGIHMIDGDSKTEYFVPDMIRDYSQPYAEQKKKSDAFAAKDGREKIEPKQPVYTMLSEYSYEKGLTALKKQAETKVLGERRIYMKTNGYLSQNELDSMSAEKAHEYYEMIRDHKLNKDAFRKKLAEIQKQASNQQASNQPKKQPVKNEFSIFEDDDAPEEPSKAPAPKSPQQVSGENEFTIFENDIAPKAETKPEPPKSQPGKPVSNPPQSKPSGQDPSVLHGSSVPTTAAASIPTSAKPETQSPSAAVRKPAASVRTAPKPADFAKLGAELENAKTTVNSKQYKLLMNTIKALGDPSYSEEQRVKLMLVAASTVDDYIAHKAKDGVKPNVFRKLEAVEKVSRYLHASLEPYHGKTYTIENTTVPVDSIPLRSKEREAAVPAPVQQIYRQLLKQNPVVLSVIPGKQQHQTAEYVNVCMNKIILSAAAHDSKIMPELINMRATFANPQFVAAQFPEKKKAPVSKNTGGLRK